MTFALIIQDGIVDVIVRADYGRHANCLQKVQQSTDCNAAYPQALPVISYTANSGASNPPDSSALNVADSADLIRWAMSAHV